MKPVIKRISQVVITAGMAAIWSAAAYPAAPPPDAGTLLNTVKPLEPQPSRSPDNMITLPQEQRPAMQEKPGLKIIVKHVIFSGVQVFQEAELQALIKDKIGKELNFNDLTVIAGLVTKYYRDHGYMVARAYLPEQPINGDTIEIAVLEGKMGKVDVHYTTPGPKMSDALLQSFVDDHIPVGAIFTVPKLERTLLLLNELPNLKAVATLVPGASVGTSDLVLEATQQGWFANDTIDVDNYGNRYSGAGRYGGSANLSSPAGLGDLLSVRALTSFEGFNYARLSWSLPASGSGLKLGVAESYSDYHLGGPLEAAGLKGNSQVVSLFEVYPFIRSRFFNVYETATVETKTLYNAARAGELSDQHIKDLALGIHGDDFDNWLGGGITNFSATYTIGHVDLSSNATDQANDSATANTAGGYQKLLLQGLRQQYLTDNLLLYGSFTEQIANKNLNSSESLGFGGPNGVRAYPVGEAPADEGTLINLELRYNTLAPDNFGSLQYQLFYDYGRVKLHQHTWSSFDAAGLANSYDLKGAGVGINVYKENRYLLNAALATKIGSNPEPGQNGTDADGHKSTTRLWMQATFYW